MEHFQSIAGLGIICTVRTWPKATRVAIGNRALMAEEGVGGVDGSVRSSMNAAESEGCTVVCIAANGVLALFWTFTTHACSVARLRAFSLNLGSLVLHPL